MYVKWGNANRMITFNKRKQERKVTKVTFFIHDLLLDRNTLSVNAINFPTTEWAEVGGGGGKSKLYHRVMGTRLVNVLECVPSSVFWYPSQHYGDRCAYDYLIIEHTFLSHINRLCYKALIWIFSKKKKSKIMQFC